MRKRAAVLSYLTVFVNLLYSVVMTPFVIRGLGQSEYGVYTLCTSVMSYLSLFQFGFSSTYLRYYIKFEAEGDERRAEELNGMFLVIFAAISAVEAAVGAALVINAEAVFGSRITPEEYGVARPLLILVVANVVISTAGVPFQSLLTAHERFVFQKGLSLAEILVRTAALAVLLFMGQRSVAIVAVSTALCVVTFLCNAAYALGRLGIRFRFTNFDASLLREMAGFTFFVFLQNVMDMFNWQVDKFLIARFRGAEEVGVYSIGAQINSVFMSLTTAITSLYVPLANRMVAEGRGDGELSALMIRIGRIQFMLATFVFSALVFFGRPFIRLYAGEGYERAYPVALLLTSCLILPLSMDIWYHIARAKAKHKTSTAIFAAVALLNTLVSIPLTRRYGEVGAALGTFIGMMISNNAFQIWYAARVIRLDMAAWAKNLIGILPALVPPCLFGIAVAWRASIDTVAEFIFWAAAYTAVSAASFWLFAANDREKELVRAPLRRIARAWK